MRRFQHGFLVAGQEHLCCYELMLLSYRYRLYPNNQQRQNLSRILEVHRQIYNDALQERRKTWRKCGVSIRYIDQATQLKEIRSFDRDAAWRNRRLTRS